MYTFDNIYCNNALLLKCSVLSMNNRAAYVLYLIYIHIYIYIYIYIYTYTNLLRSVVEDS